MAEKATKKKALPEDAEAYIAMARDKASPSGKVMERVRAVAQQRLESATTELELAQVENALKSVKGVSPAQTENLAAALFKDKSAEEIKEILENLTPEALVRLQQLSKATDPVSLALQTQAPTSQNRDDLLIKMLFEERGKGTENLIAMVKLMKELSPPPAPQQTITPEAVRAIIRETVSQAQGGGGGLDKTIETFKVISEMNKPFYQALTAKDKEVWDLKLKEIEAKMPQDPVETIKYVKEMSGVLGLGGQKSEIDLRLAEMKQNENIDMKRLDWEQEKWKMEQEADMTKWEQIGKILQGPVGQALQSVGNAGADRVRGGVKTVPKAVQTECPSCKKTIYVDAAANTAICGNCGAYLARGNAAENPQPASAVENSATAESTHVEAEQPVEVESEEEEENEPAQTETNTAEQ